jgi:hypothetical protein
VTPPDAAGLIELWLLQIVWGLGPWICIGIGLVVIMRGSRAFTSKARNIERRAEQTSKRGRLAISFDLVSHRMLTVASMFFAFACIGFAGLMSNALQGSIEPRVRELAVPIEQASEQTASVDFIVAVCLATLGLSLAITVFIYQELRRRALEHPATADPGARRTAAARFFARPLRVRLGITAFCAFFMCGILSQIIWGMLLVFPPPTSWLSLEAPGLLPVLIWALMCIGPAVLLAALSPTLNLAAGHARLRRRFLELSPQMRQQVARRFAIGAGVIGALIDLNVLVWIGTRVFGEAF